MALIYGYLFPLIFLLAFCVLYRTSASSSPATWASC